jgi:hypothetical protein
MVQFTITSDEPWELFQLSGRSVNEDSSRILISRLRVADGLSSSERSWGCVRIQKKVCGVAQARVTSDPKVAGSNPAASES